MGVLFLPDSGAPRAVGPNWLSAGFPSAILHEKAWKHVSGEVGGALSIKSMFSGQAYYRTEGRRVAVDDGCYLLLNHAQPYSMEIDAAQAVESFCVFFRPGFVEDVQRTLVASDAELLDAPSGAPAEVRFFDHRYPHDSCVTPRLLTVRRLVAAGGTPLDLQEPVADLASALLHARRGVWREAERIPAARASTREELYRRLHHARDLIESEYREPLTLAEMAATACLSPFHFLRQYRLLFGVSPHQHLLAIRHAAARRLLATSELPVTEVASESGFESLSHFTTTFRRFEGRLPRDYRAGFRGRRAV